MQVNINWTKARADYTTGKVASYRDLAKKYGVSLSTILRRARKEQWQTLRTQTSDKIRAVVTERVAMAEADRMTRILQVSDVLLDKLEAVIRNMDNEIGVSAFAQLTRALKDIKDIQCGSDDKKTADIEIQIGKAGEWAG